MATKNYIIKEIAATKEYISPIQSDLIKTLEDKEPLTRDELVLHMNKHRTTIYDNLIKLQKRKLIKKYTDSRKPRNRGRPLVFWHLTEE